MPSASVERGAQPCELLVIHLLQDAGIHRDERKCRRLQLEERSLLIPGRHAIFAAESRGLRDQSIDGLIGRARQAVVHFDARVHRGAGGARLEERGGERLERIVPIVVPGMAKTGLVTPLNGSQNRSS